jgi:hypothetical protein
LELLFPAFAYKVIKKEGKPSIYDFIRKKYVILTPEEWVRQHVVHYMVEHLGYPASLIQLERGLHYNQRQKRSDILTFSPHTQQPHLLIECKAPTIALSQMVLDQAIAYNHILKAPYIFITNGITLRGFLFDWRLNTMTILTKLPLWTTQNEDFV